MLESGLLVRTGTIADSQYKFALDPIAEHLAGWEWATRIRDQQSVRPLEIILAATDPDATCGFRQALRSWLEKYGVKWSSIGADS